KLVLGGEQRAGMPDLEQRIAVNVRDRFAVVFRQFRFWIPQIDLAGTAVHKEDDARLGFRREMRLFRRQWRAESVRDRSSARCVIEETVLRQQVRQRRADEAAARLPKEFASRSAARS